MNLATILLSASTDVNPGCSAVIASRSANVESCARSSPTALSSSTRVPLGRNVTARVVFDAGAKPCHHEMGFSAYCPHCFIVLFDPRLLVSCDVELLGIFQQPAKLLARWLDGPMHYRFLSRRGHRW